MLSEEEKRAMNNLNFIVVTDIYDNKVSINKTEMINEYNHSVGIVLNLITKLQKENEELKSDNLEKARILEMFDDRKYRKKYLEERRKEEPNLLYPDGDEIYKKYYEQKKQIDLMAEYIDNSNYVDSEECQFQYDFKIKKCIEKGDCKDCIKQYFESKSKEE